MLFPRKVNREYNSFGSFNSFQRENNKKMMPKCKNCNKQAVVRIKELDKIKYYFFCSECYHKLPKIKYNMRKQKGKIKNG